MSVTTVLARKFRPKNFAELVGQDHVVRALSNALETQRLHHAYLFTGTRGVGKTTIARIMAKALNCETGVTPAPCGKCSACMEIDSGRFVDLLEVDAATNTKVEEMRDLLDKAQYMPASGRYKVYIIDEVHMLSKSAFNSMLKTLEEPPEHVKFILATTDPQKVPVTVLSRCLQFNLKQMPPTLIAEHLQVVLKAENIPFEIPALHMLGQAAQGSMRDSLSLLDQAIAFGGGKITTAQISDMLGTVDQGHLFNLLDQLAANDGKSMLDEAEHMAARSFSFEAALQDIAAILHRLALLQTVPASANKAQPMYDRLEKLAKTFSPEDVQLYYQIALNGRRDLAMAPDDFAGFSMTLMRMLAFRPDSGGTSQGNISTPVAAKLAPSVATKPSTQTVMRSPAPAMQVSAPTPAASSNATVKFDGDWLALVSEIKLGGMAGMLAQHSELKSFEGRKFELVVPEAHKHLAEKNYQDKLKAALDAHFGTAVMLKISVGETSGNSAAIVIEKEQQSKLNSAIAAIEQDPFVRELVENMDARLIESSIKPIV
ncbi:MAG: DNA polymerase III subunit gamma/tau [Burkholderiales bacterium]